MNFSVHASDVYYPPSNLTHQQSAHGGYNMTDIICYQYIGPILCAFGILGNIVSLAILMSDKFKEAPYIYIRALAVSDIGALLVSLPFMVFSIGSKSFHWKWYEIYIFIPFANFFTAASVWITVTMTVERFVVVKFPMWAKWGCTRAGVYFRIICIFLAATMNCIPRFFTYVITSLNDDNYKLQSTSFKRSAFYYGIDIFSMVSLHVLPLLVLGSLNFLLIYEVHKARLTRKQLHLRNNHETEFQKDQRRLTVTLISIVVLSLFFIGPATVSDIFMYTEFHLRPSGLRISRIIRNLANVLLWCNLSLNFVLYCAFNKRFVNVIKNCFGCDSTIDSRYSRVGRSLKVTEATVV